MNESPNRGRPAPRGSPRRGRYRGYFRHGGFLLLALLLAGPAPGAGQEGIVVRSADVYADAGGGARRVGRIDAGTRVSVFTRRGGWKEIFAEQASIVGWVRTYQVREIGSQQSLDAEPEADSRGFLAGLAAFSRKASGFFSIGGARTSSSTATIGVRGLSEARIRSAQPDYSQLDRMAGFSSNAARLARFQAEGRLESREVGYIKPKKKAVPQPAPREK